MYEWCPRAGTPFAAPTANNTYVSPTTQMRTVLLPPLAPSPAIQLAAPPPQLVHPAPAPQPSPPTSNSAAIGTGVAAAAPADSKEATPRTTRPPARKPLPIRAHDGCHRRCSTPASDRTAGPTPSPTTALTPSLPSPRTYITTTGHHCNQHDIRRVTGTVLLYLHSDETEGHATLKPKLRRNFHLVHPMETMFPWAVFVGW